MKKAELRIAVAPTLRAALERLFAAHIRRIPAFRAPDGEGLSTEGRRTRHPDKSAERGKRRLTRCVAHLGRVPYRRPLLAFSAAPLVPSGGSRRGLPNSLAKRASFPDNGSSST
jgi:hypothetical protein